jgi:hypothetical protein
MQGLDIAKSSTNEGLCSLQPRPVRYQKLLRNNTLSHTTLSYSIHSLLFFRRFLCHERLKDNCHPSSATSIFISIHCQNLLLLFAFELLSLDGSAMRHFPPKSFIILQNSLIFFTHCVDENYL